MPNCAPRPVGGLLAVLLVHSVVAAPSAAAAFQARHGLTPSEYQDTFTKLLGEGYRLRSVSGYMSGGKERYAALWTKAAGPAWEARHGLSRADFQKAFDELAKKGYRLRWFDAHEAGGPIHFAGIWEKSPGPEWACQFGLDDAQYQKAFDDYKKKGFRPVQVCGYAEGGASHYGAIFEKSGGVAWEARNGQTAAQYQASFDELVKKGYRLRDVSGWNAGGTDRYAGIWEKAGGPHWSARNGIPDAWYQNVYDNHDYEGYEPVLVTAFSSGGRGKLNAIWENTQFPAADLDLIHARIKAYMSSHGVPGAALAITKDGRLVYAHGFGLADKESGEEVGAASQFRIASVSKNITTAAVMKLVEAGKLHLGDHVFGKGSLLGGDFPTPAGNPRIEKITVKDLLQHVSGLSNTGGDPMFMNTSMNHAQLIAWMLKDPAHMMNRDPRTRFEYLNFGYCLLGRIIEKVTGKGYERFVKDAVLEPCGVRDMAIAANSAAGRRPREVKYYPADAYSLNVARFDAHGGWVASPIDLVRYVVRVDGQTGKPDILGKDSRTQMLTDSGIKDKDGKDPYYGFGWGLPQWHNGDITGTIAFLEVLSNGFTYAVLANTRPGDDSGAFALQKVVQKLIGDVKGWPAYDRF